MRRQEGFRIGAVSQNEQELGTLVLSSFIEPPVQDFSFGFTVLEKSTLN